MKIVRSDTIGTIDMRLIRRPTNTCAGVDNWHLYANGATDEWKAPIVRFLGTNAFEAHLTYDQAKREAQAIYKAIPL